MQAASLLMTAALFTGGALQGQIAVPKYSGPVEAPRPQQQTLPTPPAVTLDATVVEYPIVRVNDQIVDNSDYLRAEQLLTDEAQETGMSAADLEQRRKDLLRDLIDQQLMLSRGKELEIKPETEVIRQLDEIRKKYHFDSMEALEKAVRESGQSYEDFKAKITNDTITGQVVREEVSQKLAQPLEKQEQAYYDEHKQEFQQPEQVRLSEILIPTPDDATDAQVAQAQAKADQVEAQLKSGAKFEDLVKQNSGGPNADSGGDLGEFKRGQLGSKVLEDPTFALDAGGVAAPIRTRQGFVILKVTEHTQAGIPPFSAVKEQIEQAMYEQAMQPALRTYLTGLREKAYIDIAPGFTDTGASPNETKPVFASATEPTVKKKVAQKARLDQARAASALAKASANAAKANRTAPASPTAKTVNVATGKRPKKIKREKIRYGQMPRNSLPAAPEETLASGDDQGPGPAASLPAAGEAIAPIDQSDTVADNAPNPLEAVAPERKKTRYADRQVEVSKTKAATKVVKAKAKTEMVAPPMTAEEKATQQTQSAALGLSGDTASKKKKKKVKGAPKERIQEAPPAPPAPKPEATPIPPKSVRDNGEPVVAPPPSNLPPAATPATPQ